MLPSKNLKLFLRFLLEFGYSITPIDDFGLMYKVQKGSFLKFICSTDFNSCECSKLLKDKALTYRALDRLGIGIPQGTSFVVGKARNLDSIENVISYLTTASYPLVVKPNDSLLGRGITILGKYDEAQARKAVLKAKKHSRLLLVQEYLAGQEFRIIAIEGEILIGVKKFERPKPPKEISVLDCAGFLDIVTISMKSLGALVCGYDIIVDNNYIKVLEINSNPTVCPIEEYLSRETLERYFSRLEHLLRRNYGH